MKHKHIWNKTLGPNEEVKHEFSVGDRYRMVCLIFWAVISLVVAIGSWWVALLVAALAAFYFGFYLKVANAYAFTDHRVLIHTGWLSTKLVSTEFSKITDVTVTEPFLDSIIFKTGGIDINTAGSKGEEIKLKHVERPYELKKTLDSLRGRS